MKPLTREQVIRALERLEKGWPKDLLLFSASGTLCLIEDPLGEDRPSDSFRSSDVLWDSVKIRNDGGDPDWIEDEIEDDG